MKDLLELSVRVFNDTLPLKSDAHFLYSQTTDNEASVVASAVAASKKVLTDTWLIMQTKALSGYEGFEVFRNALQKGGIPPKSIKGVPTAKDMLHTLIESLAAVTYCKENQIKTLIVSAAPFQQLRAFMTAVTAAERVYPALKVYSLSGKAFNWSEEVVHSQGKTMGSRSDLIHGEIERISIYGEKGDLLKVPEVLTYLNRRK